LGSDPDSLLKKSLAERMGNNRDGYTDAKTGFITRMLARARQED